MLKPITPESLYDYSIIEDPQFSPDGKLIAFVKQTADDAANGYIRSIFLSEAFGRQKPVRFTLLRKKSGILKTRVCFTVKCCIPMPGTGPENSASSCVTRVRSPDFLTGPARLSLTAAITKCISSLRTAGCRSV